MSNGYDSVYDLLRSMEPKRNVKSKKKRIRKKQDGRLSELFLKRKQLNERREDANADD